MKRQLIEDKGLRNRLRHQAIEDLDRDRRKAAEVARDRAREDKSREARRTKSTAPIAVTAADGSTRLEVPTPAPAPARSSRPRRRPSRSQKLPTRVSRLTAAQRRAQAALEDRAAEVARRRDQLAVLEEGSNR